MSQVDAQTALKIYKRFCGETERVVTYLGVAKKMQSIINVPIPNLKHVRRHVEMGRLTRQAPVSLAGSLEEYLRDPNFENNRAEYAESKRIADGRPAAAPSKSPAPAASSSADKSTTPKPATPPAQTTAAIHDFFASIESEQQSMFNPNTGSPTTAYFQAQAQYNPFAQRAVAFGPPNAFGQFLQPQPTGAFAMAPQATGYMQPQPTGAFAMPQQGFMQAQPTGAFMQPQQQQPSAFLSVRKIRSVVQADSSSRR